jgi:hypothetical protein
MTVMLSLSGSSFAHLEGCGIGQSGAFGGRLCKGKTTCAAATSCMLLWTTAPGVGVR